MIFGPSGREHDSQNNYVQPLARQDTSNNSEKSRIIHHHHVANAPDDALALMVLKMWWPHGLLRVL